MNEIRTPSVVDVYAGDTAAAARAAGGMVFCFDIQADLEPDVLVRIAGICNLANVTPRRMTLARSAQAVHVRVELDGITGAVADSIRRKLLQLTCVESVALA